MKNARDDLRFAGFVFATIATAYLVYKVLSPFKSALVWAIALAIVARPLHRRLEPRIHNRSLCAGLVVLIVTLVLVIPLATVTEEIVSQAADGVRTLQSPEGRAKVMAPLTTNPKTERLLQWLHARIDIEEQAQAALKAVGSVVPAAFMGSVAGLGQLVIALFALFFLLRDIDYFARALRWFVPLSDADTDAVLSRVQQTIDASVRGRVLIAGIQGALGGMMFWFLGVPGAVLWGAAMAFFALLPMLGAFVVWMPAALFLLTVGHPIKAAILTAWGALVIGTIDNLLYPVLVGKDLRMHTLAIFFSVLGGVAAFGASGLVIGPVVFAVAGALIEIWARRGSKAPATPSDDPVAESRIATVSLR